MTFSKLLLQDGGGYQKCPWPDGRVALFPAGSPKGSGTLGVLCGLAPGGHGAGGLDGANTGETAEHAHPGPQASLRAASRSCPVGLLGVLC